MFCRSVPLLLVSLCSNRYSSGLGLLCNMTRCSGPLPWRFCVLDLFPVAACSVEEPALPAVALALLSGVSLAWLLATLGFAVASVARCGELEAVVGGSPVLCSSRWCNSFACWITFSCKSRLTSASNRLTQWPWALFTVSVTLQQTRKSMYRR